MFSIMEQEVTDSIERLQIYNLPQIRDLFAEPTKVQSKQYASLDKKSSVPIIIDYGAGFTKAVNFFFFCSQDCKTIQMQNLFVPGGKRL